MKILLIRVLALLCCALTLCPVLLSSTVQAANACPSSISGNMNKTVTFTVKTDKSWLTRNIVKLSATKGTVREDCSGKTARYYGIYNVTVKGGGKTKTYTLSGSSLKITGLKKNTEYRITVKPYSVSDFTAKHFLGFIRLGGTRGCGCWSWKTQPTWKVSKTRGITLCTGN